MTDHSKTNIVDPKLIWEKLINALQRKFTITYTGNNPYYLVINNEKAFVYLRNLTRAYTNHSPDVCRIQLHKSNHFKEIKNSEMPFIAIGYCDEHNTIATWQSELIKPRLNGKGNVSLYCRFSEMISNTESKIRECRLRNGTIVKITNLDDLDLFFIDTFKDLKLELMTSSDELEKELYIKLKDVIDDQSELMCIKISVEFYEKHKLDYDLISIKNLISKFKCTYKTNKNLKTSNALNNN